MVTFETVNELTLKVSMDAGDFIHTKMGSMIGFQGAMKFDKELLGPGNNVVGQVLGQLTRRFTGENMSLMRTQSQSQAVGYFAFEANHVVVINLAPGERIAVESENILAFTPSCKYGVMFLPLGAMSQKGLATSTITGPGQAAILVDGNPIVLKGQCCVDPDAMVAFTGAQPTLGLDLNFKNLIGQASGETYNMKFNDPNNVVIIQPKERKSGINIGMDGGDSGQRAHNQHNQSIGQAGQSIGQTLGGIGDMLGGGDSGASGGGIGNIIGGLFR